MMAAKSEASTSGSADRLPTEKELQQAIKQKQGEIELLKKILTKRQAAKVDPRQIRMFE